MIVYIFHKTNKHLTDKAVESARQAGWTPTIIDNSPDFDYQSVGEARLSDKFYTFAAMHNWMIETVGSYFWMHNDVVAPPETFRALADKVEEIRSGERKVGAVFADYDRLCWFNGDAFKQAGYWDLALPQYYSDVDVYRRVGLAGYEMLELGLPLTHDHSNTIKDRRFADVHANTFDLYGEYYRRKWGALYPNEIYITPFNR